MAFQDQFKTIKITDTQYTIYGKQDSVLFLLKIIFSDKDYFIVETASHTPVQPTLLPGVHTYREITSADADDPDFANFLALADDTKTECDTILQPDSATPLGFYTFTVDHEVTIYQKFNGYDFQLIEDRMERLFYFLVMTFADPSAYNFETIFYK